jgi:trimeric autotransporter adhesin
MTVERPKVFPVVASVSLLLLAAVGCGQFFPSSNTITSLSIAPLNTTVAPGVTQQYSATATYGNNTTGDVTSTVTWSSNQPSIASITAGGLLSGVSLGTTTVKAQSGSVIATTGVTVTTKQVSSVTIAPLTQTLSLSLGPTTVQFTATATYKDGTTGDVTATSTWNALPSSVAAISSSGLATATTIGTCTVTATNGGVTSNSATITVVQ